MSLSSQIEVLSAIYPEEITVAESDDGKTISAQLPFKDCEISGKHHVSCILTAILKAGVCPLVLVSRVRGLDEKSTDELEEKMQCLLKSEDGQDSLLYDLFTTASNFLASHSWPTLPCPICLSQFTNDDVFTRLDCDHSYHNVCLGEYIVTSTAQLDAEEMLLPPVDRKEFRRKNHVVCPSCRSTLPRDILSQTEHLRSSRPPCDDLEQPLTPGTKTKLFTLSEEFREIFERQKRKGGLIGFEPEPEEENRQPTEALPETQRDSEAGDPSDVADVSNRALKPQTRSNNHRPHHSRGRRSMYHNGAMRGHSGAPRGHDYESTRGQRRHYYGSNFNSSRDNHTGNRNFHISDTGRMPAAGRGDLDRRLAESGDSTERNQRHRQNRTEVRGNLTLYEKSNSTGTEPRSSSEHLLNHDVNRNVDNSGAGHYNSPVDDNSENYARGFGGVRRLGNRGFHRGRSYGRRRGFVSNSGDG